MGILLRLIIFAHIISILIKTRWKRNDMATVCDPCGRTYRSANALRQHYRDSPAHRFECEDCDRTFETEHALEQHLKHSSAHNFECEDCDRTFGSEHALEQHRQYSSLHQTLSDVYKSQGGLHHFMYPYGLKREYKQRLTTTNEIC